MFWPRLFVNLFVAHESPSCFSFAEHEYEVVNVQLGSNMLLPFAFLDFASSSLLPYIVNSFMLATALYDAAGTCRRRYTFVTA